MDFREAVARLRRWVAAYPSVEPRSAEWESEFPAWGEVYAAARTIVSVRPAASWSAVDVDDMLFAIARDNEEEAVADVCGAVPAILLMLADAAVDRGEQDARWQIAAQLGNHAEHRTQAVALLLRLICDDDEYVRRRALLAVGALRADEAEGCAERAWASGEEYQRIAALQVLVDLTSSRLAHYLRLAEDDGRTHVRAAAASASVR